MKKSLRPVFKALCLLGLLKLATAPAAAVAPPRLLAQLKQATGPIPAQKIYYGINPEPAICDTSSARGWFYWYMDAVGQCYIFPMASAEEANRQAFNLIENSFSVVASGYGLRDSSGRPIHLPPDR